MDNCYRCKLPFKPGEIRCSLDPGWPDRHYHTILVCNERLCAEVEALREALEEYGTHAPGCRVYLLISPDTCTCGLQAALAAGRK